MTHAVLQPEFQALIDPDAPVGQLGTPGEMLRFDVGRVPGNGAMFFTTLSVPVCPGGTDPSKCIRDYYDFIRYTQSTQGHLNSQGLCYIDRQFPSPPGGS